MRRTVIIFFTLLFCYAAQAQNTQPAASDSYRFEPVVTSGRTAATSTFSESTNQSPNIEALPAAIPDEVDIDTALDDKHKLLAGDRVSFRILEDRDPPNTPPTLLTVTDSGELNVPYIRLVNVSGKTCRQAAEEIKTLLEKDYYYKATVILGLDQATKVVGKFYIYGNVRAPGGYDLPVNETFTAGKAITRAGGFADFADKKSVKVIRTVDGQKQTFEVNMVEIWEKGKIEKDVPLLPDDYIFVPQKLINF